MDRPSPAQSFSNPADAPLRAVCPVLCWWVGGGVFLAVFVLYLATLAPTVVTMFDDSLEFQLVTYLLGIAHPTGYPLYTLLGKLFTLLPVGDVAYRVNLMSAVFGAVAAALVYMLTVQISLPRRGAITPDWPVHLGGLVAAGMFAVGPVFWRQATIAEVYTLNAVFVAVLLLLTLLLKGETGWLWLAFLTGLSLTHHRTIVLLFPALAVYLLLYHRQLLFDRRLFWKAVGLGLLPLLLYLYLPLRGHIGSLDGTYENSWAGFWRHVAGGGYSLFIFGNPFGQERPLNFYWTLLADQVYTTVPGLLGLAYLYQFGQRRFLLLPGLAFVTFFTFNLFYNVADIEVFFIPVFLIWAVWSGVGAGFLLRTAAKLPFVRWRPVISGALLGIFGFMLVHLGMTGGQRLRQQYTWQVHDYGLDMLAQPRTGEKSAVVGILGEMTLLRYFQYTEHVRPDIITVAADREFDRLTAVERLLADGATVYLTRQLPSAADRWSLNAVGPLIRVAPPPVTTPPAFAVPVGRRVAPQITLLGYTISRPLHTDPGPAPVRLTLVWQVDGPISAALKVSARLLNDSGEVVSVTDAAPVHFAYPTTAWRPGEFVTDVYDLHLPADLPPGVYTPLIIWYDPARNAAEVGRIELFPITGL